MNAAPTLTMIIAIIAAVGGLAPLLTALVNQPRFPKWVRTLVAIVVSGVLGVIAYGQQTGFDFTSPPKMVITVVGIIIASAASYKLIWSGVTPHIEAATSPAAKSEAIEYLPYPEPAASIPDDVDEAGEYGSDDDDEPDPEEEDLTPQRTLDAAS